MLLCIRIRLEGPRQMLMRGMMDLNLSWGLQGLLMAVDTPNTRIWAAHTTLSLVYRVAVVAIYRLWTTTAQAAGPNRPVAGPLACLLLASPATPDLQAKNHNVSRIMFRLITSYRWKRALITRICTS